MIRRLGAFAPALALPLLLAAVGTATAQEAADLEVRVREVSFDSSSQTRVIVSVAGPALPSQALDASAFAVTEQGEPVTEVTAEPLFGTTQQVAVALVIDVSRSTEPKLPAAKAAAKQFLDGLPSGVRVALYTFGAEVRTLSDFATLGDAGSDHRARLGAAIDALAPAPVIGTKLYDAVVGAADALDRQSGAQANLVIFSDGDDFQSASSQQDALGALTKARAATTGVLLSVERSDEASLVAFADAVEGGGSVRVEDPAELATAFGRVAQAIASQYVLTYSAAATEPRDLSISVSVVAGSAGATDSVAVINERASVTEVTPRAPAGPLVPAFSNRVALLLAILAIFISLLLFIGMLFYAPAGRRAEKLLARGLKMYTVGSREKKKKQRNDGGALSATAFGRAAVGLADRLPRPKEFDERMQAQLDKAGWPLRSTEFLLIQLGGLIVGSLLGFVLFRSPVVGVFLTVLGAVAPRLALSNTIQRRESAFLSQLPDTLQLLAGSLQAGYGFMQALDTVSKESAAPTSTEFARVIAEARLGMPVEEALDSMAERVGGEDFKWVVLAINIQRQVGGNLAQLLSTVADTLREREQVRRQIKVLSAEGRLSAIILTALPFVLVGYLSVVNPEYLGSLTSESAGRIAIVIALVLMGIGGVWMRKIIKIDV